MTDAVEPKTETAVRQRSAWVEGLLGQAFAIGLALLGGALITLAVGENPLHVFAELMRGAFGSPERIASSLLQATPIIICGAAACVALRGGLFNIGVEGQLYVGGFAAAWVGFAFALPAGIHAVAALVAAFIAGGLWIAIPAFVLPSMWLGRLFWKGGDEKVIDRFGPDGAAILVARGNRLTARLQSGYVYTYALVMLLGIAAATTWAMAR